MKSCVKCGGSWMTPFQYGCDHQDPPDACPEPVLSRVYLSEKHEMVFKGSVAAANGTTWLEYNHPLQEQAIEGAKEMWRKEQRHLRGILDLQEDAAKAKQNNDRCGVCDYDRETLMRLATSPLPADRKVITDLLVSLGVRYADYAHWGPDQCVRRIIWKRERDAKLAELKSTSRSELFFMARGLGMDPEATIGLKNLIDYIMAAPPDPKGRHLWERWARGDDGDTRRLRAYRTAEKRGMPNLGRRATPAEVANFLVTGNSRDDGEPINNAG